jgi:hypothetical protein
MGYRRKAAEDATIAFQGGKRAYGLTALREVFGQDIAESPSPCRSLNFDLGLTDNQTVRAHKSEPTKKNCKAR